MNFDKKNVRFVGCVTALLFFSISCAGRIPLPEGAATADASELRERLILAKVPIHSLSADARLTYFGNEGRAKLSATVILQRSDHFRYDVMGPHGGTVSAFATNGLELTALDVGTSRFMYGRATAAAIDRLLPVAPLGLTPEGWVSLLLGEILPPPEATLSYDDRLGLFCATYDGVGHETGNDAGYERRLYVDPKNFRVKNIEEWSKGKRVTHVEFLDRDRLGIPTKLYMKVIDANMELEIRLEDIDVDPELSQALFVLTPPAGVTPEYIGVP